MQSAYDILYVHYFASQVIWQQHELIATEQLHP